MARVIQSNGQAIRKSYALPYSKSVSNRLLILQDLYAPDLEILNLSKSSDTQILQKVLSTDTQLWDVGDAGSSLRFLLALAVAKKYSKTLTGSRRMKERPIGPLVDSLRQINADIEYIEKAGFVPLGIQPSPLVDQDWKVQADISSQFVSALALILPYLRSRGTIELVSTPVSVPYIDMTLKLMQGLGIRIHREDQRIIYTGSRAGESEKYTVPSDYSALAFPMLELAMAGGEIWVSGLTSPDGLQGDEVILEMADILGIELQRTEEGLRMKRRTLEREVQHEACLDFGSIPDLALPMTLAMTSRYDMFYITGIDTLNYKESERWEVCKELLEALGYSSTTVEGTQRIQQVAPRKKVLDLPAHGDHRVVMCMASMHAVFAEVRIDTPDAVRKSWPQYWKQFENECS